MGAEYKRRCLWCDQPEPVHRRGCEYASLFSVAVVDEPLKASRYDPPATLHLRPIYGQLDGWVAEVAPHESDAAADFLRDLADELDRQRGGCA
jgi:hypothetical protein